MKSIKTGNLNQLFWIIAFFILCFQQSSAALFASAFSNQVAGNFDQAEELLIAGQFQKALDEYQAVIQHNANAKEVMLSHYKTAFIYDTRLFDYEKAIKWYQRFIETYPDQPLTAVAAKRMAQFRQFKEAGQLQQYQDFNQLAGSFYQRLNAPEKSSAELKRIAKQIYQLALDGQTVIFAEELLTKATIILAEARLFRKAEKMMFLTKHTFPLKDIISPSETERIIVHASRERINLWAMIVLAVLLLCLLAELNPLKISWGEYIKNALLTKIFWIVLIILTAYYFLFVIRDHENTFTVRQLLIMYGLYFLAVVVSQLIGKAFTYVKNQWLRFTVQWLYGMVWGVCLWLVFAYHIRHLKVIGL
jgi:tetratricopeptide (TPR) repeat protein